MTRTKHPADRQQRNLIDEKKQREVKVPRSVRKQIQEHIYDEETKDELKQFKNY